MRYYSNIYKYTKSHFIKIYIIITIFITIMSQPSTPTLEPPRSDPNNFLASPEKEENPENQGQIVFPPK